MVRFELEMLIQLCKSARNRISLTCMSTQLFFQSISKFIMRSEKYNSELLILNFASTGVLKIPFSIFVMHHPTRYKSRKNSWHGVFTRLEKLCMFSAFFASFLFVLVPTSGSGTPIYSVARSIFGLEQSFDRKQHLTSHLQVDWVHFRLNVSGMLRFRHCATQLVVNKHVFTIFAETGRLWLSTEKGR